MGNTASCFKGSEVAVQPHDVVSVNHKHAGRKLPASCQLHDVHAQANGKQPASRQQSDDTGSCPADQGVLQKQQPNQPPPPAAAAPADGDAAPLLSCCLGVASQPGGAYDVSMSGPPLPGCEAERLEQSHLSELVDFAPTGELQTIRTVVCSMFKCENALVSLFFDRRVFIIDGTGVFSRSDFPWRYSLCGWTMASERHCVMVVNDVWQDARFCNNPGAKSLGVRFYVGAPLVSSGGHRIGTLCFADSKPRVFDDASMKLLCNLSELVTRALERDIVLAHHQHMAKPGQALKGLEQKHRYGMLLRSLECINSPVLLVDTGTPGWTVRYANLGWQELLQQHNRSQATMSWVEAASAAPPPTNTSNSGPLAVAPGGEAAADGGGAGADGGASASCAGLAAAAGEGKQQSNGRTTSPLQQAPVPVSDAILGRLLWPGIQQQLAREADGGKAMTQRLQQLLAAQQPFTLHGLELEGLGEQTASFVFRSAGLSDIEGSVPVCVPTWVPPSTAVDSAAAALQAGAEDKTAPDTTCAQWQSLYFVTVQLDSPRDRRDGPPGVASASCGTFPVSPGRGGGKGSSSGVGGAGDGSGGGRGAGRSGIVLSVPSAEVLPNSASQSVYDDSNLLVMSAIGQHNTSSSSSSDSTDSNVQQPGSSSAANSSSRETASVVGSAVTSITSNSSAAAARAVCRRIEGLRLGGLIAAGSYGRVYRGEYYTAKVAVKVLESDCVLRREASTGLCLEALLGEKFKHPNIIRTLAWAVVTGKNKLAVGRRPWGESLDSDRPSIADNRAAAVAAAAAQGPGQQRQLLSQRSTDSHRGSQLLSQRSTDSRASMELPPSVSQQLPALMEQQDEQQQQAELGSGMASSSLGTGPDNSSSLQTAETWLVLELCDKGCLQDCIDRGWLRSGPNGPVSLAKVVVTATEIAAGMYTLHRADVLHGDLSPYNVLLTGSDSAAGDAGRGYVAKISDFGLSRPMGGRSKLLTKTYGTMTHMSPELLEHGVCSKAVDVYSFGVLLWQMLASSRAWAGLSHSGVVHAVCVLKQQLQFPPEAPEALVQLGRACMAHDPAERPTFADILEVLTPLRQFIVDNTG